MPPTDSVQQEPQTRHTPGPWHAHAVLSGLGSSLGSAIVDDSPDRNFIARMIHCDELGDSYLANARLIIAAPELLAALVAIRAAFTEPKAFAGWSPGAIADAIYNMTVLPIAHATERAMNCENRITEADIHDLEADCRIEQARAPMLDAHKWLRDLVTGFGAVEPDTGYARDDFRAAMLRYLEATGALCKCGLPAGACDLCGVQRDGPGDVTFCLNCEGARDDESPTGFCSEACRVEFEPYLPAVGANASLAGSLRQFGGAS